MALLCKKRVWRNIPQKLYLLVPGCGGKLCDSLRRACCRCTQQLEFLPESAQESLSHCSQVRVWQPSFTRHLRYSPICLATGDKIYRKGSAGCLRSTCMAAASSCTRHEIRGPNLGTLLATSLLRLPFREYTSPVGVAKHLYEFKSFSN